jgi:choline dehydrogenase-like flavoprotein
LSAPKQQPPQVTQHNGRRADAFMTHLKPVMSRPNLTVVTGTQAMRVGLEQGGAGKPRAVGVEFSVGHVAQSDRFTGALRGAWFLRWAVGRVGGTAGCWLGWG